MCRADSRLASSQWETSLQSNAVSHRLGTNLELAVYGLLSPIIYLTTNQPLWPLSAMKQSSLATMCGTRSKDPLIHWGLQKMACKLHTFSNATFYFVFCLFLVSVALFELRLNYVHVHPSEYKSTLGSINALVLNRSQTFTWTNDGSIHPCIHASKYSMN